MSVSTAEPLLAWDEPVVFVDDDTTASRSVASVSARDAQRYLRYQVDKFALKLTVATAVLVSVGALLWVLSVRDSFWFKLGLVLTVGSSIRLAFDLSRLLEAWLTVPAFHAGRLEIYKDRIVRGDGSGKSLEWPLADIRQVRLRTYAYATGTRRVMTIRLGRLRNFQVVVPSTVSFDDLATILARIKIPVSRPAT